MKVKIDKFALLSLLSSIAIWIVVGIYALIYELFYKSSTTDDYLWIIILILFIVVTLLLVLSYVFGFIELFKEFRNKKFHLKNLLSIGFGWLLTIPVLLFLGSTFLMAIALGAD